MNLYATLGALKASLGVTSTARDAVYLSHLEGASRRIDLYCGRVFFVSQGVRFFDGPCGPLVYTDDYLRLDALGTDSELDGTFDGEAWVEGADYVTSPYNAWPKFGIEVHVAGGKRWTPQRRYIKATGLWGYGDGERATPWDLTAVLASVGSLEGTELILSVDGVVSPGHTLVIEDEQVFVESVGTLTAVVKRGVNGTTAAVHSAAAVSLVRYPASVERACVTLAIAGASREGKAGMQTERIGDYSYTLTSEGDEGKFLERALIGLTRPI